MNSSRAGLIGTVTVHAALFATAFWVSRHVTEPVQMVHAITLIAAPAPTPTAPSKPSATPTPVKNDKIAPILKPKKTPDKPKPVVDKPDTPAAKTPPVVPPPLTGVTPNTGQDVANIKIEGFASRYPEYVTNIMNRVGREWDNQWKLRGAIPPLTTEVSFVIHEDGSVSDIKTERGSRSYDFDGVARVTIELVGKAATFGALPPGVGLMPISFTFKPVKP